MSLQSYLCIMTDEDTGQPSADTVRMLDASALKALAHPLRVQIYDILSQYGPQTASTLAELTGESSGATSYHLRALAKHDLIREVDDRGTGRERWWERPRGGISFTNPEAMKTPSGKAATQVVMTEFLTRRHQQLMRYLNESIQAPDESKENAVISTATVRMTYDQTVEFIAELQAVIDAAAEKYRDQRGEGVVPISVRSDVFPLPEEGHST
jgi:DNA-binding transcriptional ArsR family regulator